MLKQRAIFESGALKNGINRKLAIKIFDLLEKFAGYGFNKSHSVAYALVSYQTLWLKTHYPAEFMASVMTSDIDNTEKIVILVNEILRIKVKIIPPNINLSKYEFYVDDQRNIVYGMGAIKGIGASSVRTLVEEREKNGIFTDLFDLCMRVNPNKITYKVLEKLIMSGSCDCFNQPRNYLLKSIDDAIKASKESLKIRCFKQDSLFGVFQDELKQVKKNNFINLTYSKKNELDDEYQVLGFYLTGHPINQYAIELKHYLKNITLSELKNIEKNKKILVAGVVVSIKIKTTKNKNRIAILILDDNTSHLEVIIFQDLLKLHESLLKLNKILIIEGVLNISFFNKSIKMTASNIMNLNMARKKYINKLTIILKEENIDILFLKKIYECLEKQPKGNIPIYIAYYKRNICLNLKLNNKWFISITDDFLNELKNLVGFKKILLK